MGEVVLCSGNIPLAFNWTRGVTPPSSFSSHDTTGRDYEQIMLDTPDPMPKTDDWMHFICEFNSMLYESARMSAYITGIRDTRYVNYSNKIDNAPLFRAVCGTSKTYIEFQPGQEMTCSGYRYSATMPRDGYILPEGDWNIYSSYTAKAPVVTGYTVTYSAGGSGGITSESSVINTAYGYGAWKPVYVSGGERTGYSAKYSASGFYLKSSSLPSESKAFSSVSSWSALQESAYVTGTSVYPYYTAYTGYAYSAYITAGITGTDTWLLPDYSGDFEKCTTSVPLSTPAYGKFTASGFNMRTYGNEDLIYRSVKTYVRPLIISMSAQTALATMQYYSASAGTDWFSLTSIAGSYSGTMSAAIGNRAGSEIFNPYGVINTGGPSTSDPLYWSGDSYWRFRYGWGKGGMYEFPSGCQMSGIIQFKVKENTGDISALVCSSTGE